MRYLFTESYPVTYSQYRDAGTGNILTAYDGEHYDIEAIVDGLPVPPEDGRWTEAGGIVPSPPAATAATPPDTTTSKPDVSATAEEPAAETDSSENDGEG